MTMMTPPRFIRSLKKTPIILDYVLKRVNHTAAHTMTDGPEGWSIVQVVCHLRDFEEIFYTRARLMIEQERPALPAFDHLALAVERDYQGQDLRAALREFAERRRQHVALLEGLNESQWWRSGVHAEAGVITVIEQAMQVSLHDVDHTEQIVHVLEMHGA